MGVAAVAGRPPYRFARLRDARIHHLPVECHFGGRERSEKLVAALGIHAEAERQLAVGGEVVGLGRRILRRFGRRDGDVAAVPERAPPGDVRRAFRLLAVDVPAVTVEHLVRAAEPFGLVPARVIACDRGEEEGTAVAGRPPYRTDVTRGRAVSPLTAAILPRHATEHAVRKQIRLAEIARRLVEVIHLHQVSNRIVAVHVAPAARHKTVGADGELLLAQHLPERTALAEPVAELVLADAELPCWMRYRSDTALPPLFHVASNSPRSIESS